MLEKAELHRHGSLTLKRRCGLLGQTSRKTTRVYSGRRSNFCGWSEMPTAETPAARERDSQ